MSADTIEITIEEYERLLALENHSPDTGNMVDHCVEVNEMVEELDKLGDDCEVREVTDVLYEAAALLSRTEARRVELEAIVERLAIAGRSLCDSERRGLVPYPSEWKMMESALDVLDVREGGSDA